MNSRKEIRKTKNRNKLLLILILLFLLCTVLFLTYKYTNQPSREESATKVSSTTKESKASTPELKAQEKVIDPLDASIYDNLQKNIDSEEDTYYDDYLQNSGFSGTALIIKDGKILIHKGYGFANYDMQIENNYKTLFQLGSAQKIFTATLVEHLIENKKLSFDTPLSQYYPNLTGSNDVTIGQMIQMRSGLFLADPPDTIDSQDQLIDYCLQNTTYTGNKNFKYQAVNYILLSAIIEKITNKSYYDYFNEYFHKVGLNNFQFFYDKAKDKNSSLGYAINTEVPYSRPIIQGPERFIKELGCGNVSMSTADFYYFLNQLINKKIISETTLQNIWQVNGEGQKYIGGMYDYDLAYRINGAVGGQITKALISKDGKSAVILMANINNKDTINSLITDFYYRITGYQVQF